MDSGAKMRTASKMVTSPGRAPGAGGGEETEIAAQVMMPTNGGWGWVVVASTFCCFFVNDGVMSSYGVFIEDVSKDFKVSTGAAALASSIQMMCFYVMSPIAAASINRFGFRTTSMLGSMMSAFALLASYFSGHYAAFVLFYSAVTGCFSAFINMPASVIVGFYFEKNRALALALSGVGCSVGIMVMYPAFKQMRDLCDWRTTLLVKSAMYGILFFVSFTFRPLLTLTVAAVEEAEAEPTRTVTVLPNLAASGAAAAAENISPAERLFGTIASERYPTAAALVDEVVAPRPGPPGPPGHPGQPGQPGTSGGLPGSRSMLLRAIATSRVSRGQLNKVDKVISKPSFDGEQAPRVSVIVEQPSSKHRKGRHEKHEKHQRREKHEKHEKHEKRGCCHWESHNAEARPIYRDDAFYEGAVEKLPHYQRSVAGLEPAQRTGLEYQLAVSRAVAVDDLKERRGVCTTATKRVLTSMLDTALLRQCSFISFCLAYISLYVGCMVPWIYLGVRNEEAGMDPGHCSFFVSVVGFSNAAGRLLLGALAGYCDPCVLYAVCMIVSGGSTAASGISYGLLYQYGYSVVFGFGIAANGTRSIALVRLFGLEKLTNATGMVFVCVGLGTLFGPSTAGFLRDLFGYDMAFYFSGACIASSAIFMLAVKICAKSDNKTTKVKLEKNPPKKG